MGARGLEWFLWTYCKAVAVVLFCAELRELRLRVTDSSPCRHMSGPSLTREGELFELNVGVGSRMQFPLALFRVRFHHAAWSFRVCRPNRFSWAARRRSAS